MVDRLGSWLGIVIAGALNGSFAVPMKTARAWKFEHIWGVFSIFAMVVIPWCAVLIAVPRWNVIFAAIPISGLASLVALGLIWGVASLLYGLAIDLLGIALGFSIQLGLSIVIGALVPFAIVRGSRLPLTVRLGISGRCHRYGAWRYVMRNCWKLRRKRKHQPRLRPSRLRLLTA